MPLLRIKPAWGIGEYFYKTTAYIKLLLMYGFEGDCFIIVCFSGSNSHIHQRKLKLDQFFRHLGQLFRYLIGIIIFQLRVTYVEANLSPNMTQWFVVIRDQYPTKTSNISWPRAVGLLRIIIVWFYMLNILQNSTGALCPYMEFRHGSCNVMKAFSR